MMKIFTYPVYAVRDPVSFRCPISRPFIGAREIKNLCKQSSSSHRLDQKRVKSGGDLKNGLRNFVYAFTFILSRKTNGVESLRLVTRLFGLSHHPFWEWWVELQEFSGPKIYIKYDTGYIQLFPTETLLFISK